MSNRRAFLTTSAIVAPALALGACAQIKSLVNDAGTAAGQAAVVKLVSYVQGAVTFVSTTLTTFENDIPANLFSTAQKAFGALGAAADNIGQTAMNGLGVSAVATTAQNIDALISDALKGLIAGLSAVPNPGSAVGTAITIARTTLSFIPSITSLVDNLLHPTAAAAPMLENPPFLHIMVR